MKVEAIYTTKMVEEAIDNFVKVAGAPKGTQIGFNIYVADGSMPESPKDDYEFYYKLLTLQKTEDVSHYYDEETKVLHVKFILETA